MGHYPSHQHDTGRILPYSGPLDDGKTTVEVCGQELEVPPSGCFYGICKAGGVGDLCHPPPEHSRTLYRNPSYHGTMSIGVSVPWGEDFQ